MAETTDTLRTSGVASDAACTPMVAAEFFTASGIGHPYQLPLRRVRNVRDLGGYPFVAEDGTKGVTAFGVFLRAPSLRRLNARGFALLRAYGRPQDAARPGSSAGLTCVVDLRSTFEVDHWPDPYAEGRDGVRYVHVPMLDQLNSNGFRNALPDRMFTVYRSLLDNDGASIRAVMEALDGDGCRMFHCRAGKDRTGVIAMLLLGLAGVSDEDIVSDYAATQKFAARSLGVQRVLVSILLFKRVPRCLFEAVPAEMELTLAHLHERYGMARDYLEGVAGCDLALLDRLTAKLRGWTLG